MNDISKKRQTILIVDDEPAIRKLLVEALGTEYRVCSAGNAKDARDILTHSLPSLVLLDIYMPGENGVSLCKSLRENAITKDIPIIMMTAQNERKTRIDAFDSGADDFLEKPFHLDEMFSRIESKLRRALLTNFVKPEIRIGDLVIDIGDKSALVAGKALELGQIEFDLLCFLARRLGALAKREELETSIWGKEKPVTRSLDTHIGVRALRWSQSA